MTRKVSPPTQSVEVDVEDLVTALLTASRVLVGVAARSLAGLEGAVTLPQFRMLVVLASRGESNLNTLAEALDVNSSSAMRMIDRLLAAGLVTRRENPHNRREVLLGVTATGAEVVRRVTARRRHAIHQVVADMDETHRVGLVQALSAFATAAGEIDAGEMDASGLGW